MYFFSSPLPLQINLNLQESSGTGSLQSLSVDFVDVPFVCHCVFHGCLLAGASCEDSCHCCCDKYFFIYFMY